MSVKIKDKPAKQKISKFNFNTKVCEVPETSMFFSFQYITSDKHYNIEYLKSDWSLPKDNIYSLSKTIAELYKTSNKTSEQISNDRILMSGLTVLAKLSGNKIICQSGDLDNKNKIKI